MTKRYVIFNSWLTEASMLEWSRSHVKVRVNPVHENRKFCNFHDVDNKTSQRNFRCSLLLSGLNQQSFAIRKTLLLQSTG